MIVDFDDDFVVASIKLVPFEKKVAEKLGKFYQSIEVMSFFSKNNKGA